MWNPLYLYLVARIAVDGDGLGETDGLADGDTLLLGLSDGLTDGERLLLGLTDGLYDCDTLGEADGLMDGL